MSSRSPSSNYADIGSRKPSDTAQDVSPPAPRPVPRYRFVHAAGHLHVERFRAREGLRPDYPEIMRRMRRLRDQQREERLEMQMMADFERLGMEEKKEEDTEAVVEAMVGLKTETEIEVEKEKEECEMRTEG